MKTYKTLVGAPTCACVCCSYTAAFPPPRKKSCMKPCLSYIITTKASNQAALCDNILVATVPS